MLYHIKNEADGLLGEGRDQVIVPGLLPVDPVEPEPALSQHASTNQLIGLSTRTLEVGGCGGQQASPPQNQ
jgi:hypothetical protein